MKKLSLIIISSSIIASGNSHIDTTVSPPASGGGLHSITGTVSGSMTPVGKMSEPVKAIESVQDKKLFDFDKMEAQALDFARALLTGHASQAVDLFNNNFFAQNQGIPVLLVAVAMTDRYPKIIDLVQKVADKIIDNSAGYINASDVKILDYVTKLTTNKDIVDLLKAAKNKITGLSEDRNELQNILLTYAKNAPNSQEEVKQRMAIKDLLLKNKNLLSGLYKTSENQYQSLFEIAASLGVSNEGYTELVNLLLTYFDMGKTIPVYFLTSAIDAAKRSNHPAIAKLLDDKYQSLLKTRTGNFDK